MTNGTRDTHLTPVQQETLAFLRTLPPGHPQPTVALARHRGVKHTTADNAIQRLTALGYLDPRTKFPTAAVAVLADVEKYLAEAPHSAENGPRVLALRERIAAVTSGATPNGNGR
jgi:hypothetical protein